MRRGEEWIYYYCVVLGDVLYIYTQKKNRYDTRLKQFYFIFLCAVSELTFLRVIRGSALVSGSGLTVMNYE